MIILMVVLGATPSYGQAERGWLSLLRQGDFPRLEEQTVLFQKHFAEGNKSELELRDAYRPFYDMDEQDWRKLDEWQKAYPKSYAVPLIRGAFYKRAGFNARGQKWADETSSKQFAEMTRLHRLAAHELEESRALTEKPYLSVWHLLDVQEGDRAAMKELMDAGTKMLPSNRLIRARYMRNLTPRWGGSYQEMEEFLTYARGTGATEKGLMELEAIIYDDAGDLALRSGDQGTAVEFFRKALDLGAHVGGEVPRELTHSWYNRCHLPGLEAYCQ